VLFAIHDAYASPGCAAMNIPWQLVDPLLKSWNADIHNGTYQMKGFQKGDRIVAKVSINFMTGNQFADPNGYGELGLIAAQPGATTGTMIVAPLRGGFTYVVPADTPALFIFRFEDVGGENDPGHFSVTCTNAGS
jgi:hypothetical protein